jgi:hypothetical protein
MVQHQQTGPVATPAHGYQREPRATAWVGWVFFAGIIMLIVGSFNAIAGIVALINDEYYLVRPDGLIVELDYTAWGWTLLIYGAVVCLAGLGVLAGQTWARVVAVILVSVNALVNLGFLAAYPIWTTIIITLDVVVIYALVVHGREVRSSS